MAKLQSDKTLIAKKPESPPPQIPPRMKKKGPALPEKPAHIRAKMYTSQLPHREPLKPRILNNPEKCPAATREVLVAASKSGREKPIEKRQREPAKLLKPVPGSRDTSLLCKGHSRLDEVKKEVTILVPKNSSSSLWTTDECIPLKKPAESSVKKVRQQPVLLIPRNLLTTWGSSPISYALWTQRDIGRGGVVRHHGQKSETSSSSARARSGSVTRSGSLTSQGSSSSDSAGETFNKSALKKHKKTTSMGNCNHTANRKVEPKKNVTFNAFATVRLMDE